MWETSKIESELEARLKVLGSSGEALYSRYIAARSFLTREILPWIAGKEPNLSDHGVAHIRNVLDNALQLIGDLTSLNPIEHYILCQAILFHDVGNLFGRRKHNLEIGRVYEAHFNGLWLNRLEMGHVILIGRSHSGISHLDGSNDTLKDLKDAFFESQPVRLQHLAAILRFADELAEGPQRTSGFLIRNKLISTESEIYHKYASCTHVFIDRGGSRIALSYEIPLDDYDFKSPEGVEHFTKFLKCIYSRIHKLDGERRYCKHYSGILEPFKKTSVNFHFWSGSDQIDLQVQPIDLDDLFIPGTDLKNLEDTPDYNIQGIITKILNLQEH